MRLRHAPRALRLLGGAALCVATLGCGPQSSATTPHEQRRPSRERAPELTLPDFAEVAERHVAALVSIETRKRPQQAPRSETSVDHTSVKRGFGSGIIVSDDGKILTNNHVLATASDAEIKVELHDGSRHAVRTIYRDERYDLALLQLVMPPAPLHSVQIEATDARPGQWVMAMGHPRDLGDTVTVGVVSGLGRNYREIGAPPDLLPGGVWHFLQTDVSINPGSSGGPLFNSDGAVVGLNTAVLRGTQGEFEGIAFAIPAPLLRHFLREVAAHGRARHPSLGMIVAGVRITSVDPESPAARASLQAGDVILSVAGVPVDRYDNLLYQIEIAGIDAPIQLSVARGDGAPITVAITPE
ncbi:MAG: S1C family serine protease, partial [Nannocystaceae bacterium]